MRVALFGRISARAAPRVKPALWRGDQLPNLIVFAACFCLLAGALILNPPDPVSHQVTFGEQHMPSLCTFKNLTGLPCPGCGLVRSVTAIVHGDIAGSLAYHRLGWLVFIYIAAQLLYRLVLLAIPRRQDVVERYGRYLLHGLIVVAVLLVLNWIHALVT
jgi:hypothetical protein